MAAYSDSLRPDPAHGAGEPAPLELGEELRWSVRAALVQKLGELVSWPSSRIPPYERQFAADVLVGLLRTSSSEIRARVALGIAKIHEAPKALLRYLARDEFQVAQPLLEEGVGFDDSDLIATVRAGVSAHWGAIARRKQLSEPVVDALLQTNDVLTIETALRNDGARFSAQAIDLAVARSRMAPQLCQPIIHRLETRPTQALVLFWWSDAEARLSILRRFAVDRAVLLSELGEFFAPAAKEGWSDPEVRKALQLVERRQRNRQAIERSSWNSLEEAVARAEQGLDQPLMMEIGRLAGVKPQTGVHVFSDPGGEPIAVLAKATGLKRGALVSIWKGLRRPMGDPDSPDTAYGRMCLAYNFLSNAKAQTVLRYWNWSFTAESAAAATLGQGDEGDEFSAAQRNAALLLRRGG